MSNAQRRAILDGLGRAASDYRQKIYQEDFSGQKAAFQLAADLAQLRRGGALHLEHSIHRQQAGRRPVPRLQPDDGGSRWRHRDHLPPEMLEGQVAVLSSGLLNPKESLEVLDALKASALFREDQYSYVLYPNKTLPRFLDKNNVDPAEPWRTRQAPLRNSWPTATKTSSPKDCDGGFHFNGNFHNVKALRAALADVAR